MLRFLDDAIQLTPYIPVILNVGLCLGWFWKWIGSEVMISALYRVWVFAQDAVRMWQNQNALEAYVDIN